MKLHHEKHKSHRIGWLRAAVLGANDGVISVSSLLMGVATAGASSSTILLTGVAGLVAGAMSMAAGEYVSVYSQADTEAADLRRERKELETDIDSEHRELEEIYVSRGLTRDLAKEVARQMMEHDALGAHARDELGITEISSARPILAAVTSALTFSAGALIPLLVAIAFPINQVQWALVSISLLTLAVLGGLAARAGGANIWKGAARVSFWGALALALTALIGHLFGISV